MAPGGNKKVANGLVALSSSAIVAVYAAGFMRTKAAAEKNDRAEPNPSGARSIRPTSTVLQSGTWRNSSSSRPATSTASRVLPTPPTPVSVTSMPNQLTALRCSPVPFALVAIVFTSARPVAGGDFFGYIDPDGAGWTTSSDFAFKDHGETKATGINGLELRL